MENVICGKQQPDDLEVQRKHTERNTGQRGTLRPHFEHAFSLSQMLPYLRVQEEAGTTRGYQIGFVSPKTAESIIVPRED